MEFFGGNHISENIRGIPWQVADISDRYCEETWSNTNAMEAGSWGFKGKPWICSKFQSNCKTS